MIPKEIKYTSLGTSFNASKVFNVVFNLYILFIIHCDNKSISDLIRISM